MTDYYYLTASLPHLEFPKETPISRGEFLDECAKWASEKDIMILKDIEIDDIESTDGDRNVVGRWKEYILTLKMRIATVRGSPERARAGANADSELKGIFEKADPLEMETAIEKLRWDFLEDEEASHHFDLWFLSIYLLKIQILERLGSFGIQKGRTVFEKLCEVKNG